MTKIAIITDTHWGIRNDNQIFLRNMEEFINKVFWPTIDERGIQHVIHLGDLVDRRKYINFVTLRSLKEKFMDQIQRRGIQTHIIAGNHDVYYKNTNEVNALTELFAHADYPTINFYTHDPTTLTIDGLDILLMPWIADENYEASLDRLKNTTATVVMGHFDIVGFEMYKGQVSEHGFDRHMFDKFDVVLSGHYHHRSTDGNITYLGSPGQYTWADFDDRRGFHIFDTETRELEFIENPYQIFQKFYYNDSSITLEEVMDMDFSCFKDTYTKIIVKNKENPFLFDRVVDIIEKNGVYNLQVVEDHLNLDDIADEEVIDEAQDTVSLLKKYAAQIETTVPRKRLEKFLNDLYHEAISLERA